ncbi:uncharacterized protein AMSG_06851 [Thecamonas trahens ATCC 50062]|uniref:ATP10 protein n=1 Tax=Thecamonas trahens ATCC 50062 TaxID=461836 RepID=A0A0L0DDG5_THETB|nr:hypothetical protein AMSG_06851 [Thecamonas trahens ATCC 50062]KNC50364.1 hypothetical protein AMSG_06851 [Thecamonas trahens ATCC 50062]|eukprot:XP_013756906.1 hypothetical protein AMSG_06851 [Thecamonas trahens ATCC 50062]
MFVEPSVVLVAFRDSAMEHTRDWGAALAAHGGLSALPRTHLLFVETRVLKLFKSLFVSSLRQATPASQVDATLLSFDADETVRAALGVDNRLFGYALLVDAEGRIRWRGKGPATAGNVQRLASAVSGL